MSRDLIVVDIETTGLSDRHVPLEIAAVRIGKGVPFYMVPFPAGKLSEADPMALQVNRYYERGVFKYELDSIETRPKYVELHTMLLGHTLAGSNPRFDAGMLSRAFARYNLTAEPWHHRLADLSAYAAGVLGLPATELPGLEAVCQQLGVVNKDPHSAMGDAVATAECFEILTAGSRK